MTWEIQGIFQVDELRGRGRRCVNSTSKRYEYKYNTFFVSYLGFKTDCLFLSKFAKEYRIRLVEMGGKTIFESDMRLVLRHDIAFGD
jgi:hypothetical protein